MVSRVYELSGKELPLRAVLEHGTPGKLANLLTDAATGVPPIEAADRTGPLPLSFGQQRMWFLDQLREGRSEYNLVVAHALEGPLDVPSLRRALDEVVRRHEALRTVIRDGPNGPTQLVLPSAPVALPVLRVGALGERALRERLAQVVDGELAARFDLARGPLLRARLLETRREEHVFVLAVHHIAADAWSLQTVLRELGALYAAFVERREPTLEPVPLQYADFAVWQRSWLTGDVLARQLAYWRERLDAAPPLLELREQRPRPRQKTGIGAQESFEVDERVVAALRALSRAENATLFTTLLAAFKALLVERTGRTDVIVGTAIANRTRHELERVVGFFVNLLVLRTDCSGDPTFRQLVRRVRDVALGAYSHQDAPFEAIVDELAPERTLGHTPLVQVCATYVPETENALALPGVVARELDLPERTVRFDLVLSARERSNGLLVDLEYDADLFARDAVVALGRDYVDALGRIAASPASRLTEILAPPGRGEGAA